MLLLARGALALGGHAAPGVRHAHEQREHHERHKREHIGEPPPCVPVRRVAREGERHRHADVVGERGAHDVPQVPDAHGQPRLLAGEVHGDDGGGHHAHHGNSDALEHAADDELGERVRQRAHGAAGHHEGQACEAYALGPEAVEQERRGERGDNAGHGDDRHEPAGGAGVGAEVVHEGAHERGHDDDDAAEQHGEEHDPALALPVADLVGSMVAHDRSLLPAGAGIQA